MESVTPTARRGLRVLGGSAAILNAVILAVGIVGLVVMSASIRPWLAVLVFTDVTFAGFWPGPGRPHKVWMALAVALPLAGVGVLIATGLAGRSALMAAGIVLSCLMLADRTARPLGYVGIAANSLLLVADFATGDARSIPVAALVGVGYLLLIAWFAWIAITLLAPRSVPESAGPT